MKEPLYDPGGSQAPDDIFTGLRVHKHISVRLDCARLPPREKHITRHPAVRSFFRELRNDGQPAIYWFTMISYHGCKQVYDAIAEAKKTVQRRFPYQKEFRGPTKVLYVGKTARDLVGRMKAHLGYGLRPETQGLQLYHWARRMGLKVELDCIVLSREWNDRILSLENELSKKLRPLVGQY